VQTFPRKLLMVRTVKNIVARPVAEAVSAHHHSAPPMESMTVTKSGRTRRHGQCDTTRAGTAWRDVSESSHRKRILALPYRLAEGRRAHIALHARFRVAPLVA
ncbi:hypothetical protein, partial [Rhodanobacter thiooxydans]